MSRVLAALGSLPTVELCLFLGCLMLPVVAVISILVDRRDTADMWHYVTRPALRSLGHVDPGPFARRPSARPRRWVQDLAVRNIRSMVLAVNPHARNHQDAKAAARWDREFTAAMRAALFPKRNANPVGRATGAIARSAGYRPFDTLAPDQGSRRGAALTGSEHPSTSSSSVPAGR